MVKEIQLTKGYVAIVDDEDYERVSQHKWYVHLGTRRGLGHYLSVRTNLRATSGKYTSCLLHRFILDGVVGNLDHINGNTLDNRKENLRVATPLENSRNRRANQNGTSKYLGVSWSKQKGLWQVSAHVGIENKKVGLGLFSDEVEAAQKYDLHALSHYGDFARLNFPELTDVYKEKIQNGEAVLVDRRYRKYDMQVIRSAIEECLLPDANLTDIARKYKVPTSNLYYWRKRETT